MNIVANNPIVKVVAVSMLWLFVWGGTQGFFMNSNMQALIPGNAGLQPLVAMLYIFCVSVIALLVFRKTTRELFVYSKQLYFYIIPIVLLAIMPLHYSLDIPIFVYASMILISVFWQDYLTFGLFQGYVQSQIRPLLSIIAIGIVFAVGHLIFFLDTFPSGGVYSWLGLFVAGILFAWLRYRFHTIYFINILHTSFYFLLV